jgi:hypothetical protein
MIYRRKLVEHEPTSTIRAYISEDNDRKDKDRRLQYC